MEDSEECSSSESGWTMYLASPMHEDDDDDDDDGDDHGDGEVGDGEVGDGGGEDDDRDRSNNDDGKGNDDDDGKGNDDDDDSMASDASSGQATSYIGRGKGSKVVERKNHKVEAKEEMRRTKNLKKNQDKGGGATSRMRTTKANE